MLTAFVYEGRPLGLWVLNSSYEIVGLAIVGAIIGGWKKGIPHGAETASIGSALSNGFDTIACISPVSRSKTCRSIVQRSAP